MTLRDTPEAEVTRSDERATSAGEEPYKMPLAEQIESMVVLFCFAGFPAGVTLATIAYFIYRWVS